jgi:hypothetical protein
MVALGISQPMISKLVKPCFNPTAPTQLATSLINHHLNLETWRIDVYGPAAQLVEDGA